MSEDYESGLTEAGWATQNMVIVGPRNNTFIITVSNLFFSKRPT